MKVNSKSTRSISKIYLDLNKDDDIYKLIYHCYRKPHVASGVLCFDGYKIHVFRATSTSHIIRIICHVVHKFHIQRFFVALMAVDIMLVLFTALKRFFSP